jgi:hypothetical protein
LAVSPSTIDWSSFHFNNKLARPYGRVLALFFSQQANNSVHPGKGKDVNGGQYIHQRRSRPTERVSTRPVAFSFWELKTFEV